MNDNDTLLTVRNLKKYFPVKSGILRKTVNHVKAVDDISFSIRTRETLGLVGESGCGKSTAGRVIIRLLEPTAGQVEFQGKNLLALGKSELRDSKRDMQIIFQDPYSSLNPRMTVGDIVGEPLVVHNMVSGKDEKIQRVREMLRKVGMNPEFMRRYPHEFSGGQRQRIGIARALTLNPKFVVADEPISSLDVSIQAQVINLLQDLRNEFGLTYLFIAHDLSVVKHISDRIAVMYLGKIVELVDKHELFENPLHPYTRSLLSAIPVPDPTYKKKRIILQGDVPSPVNPPSGCRFHPRCRDAKPICSAEEPIFKDFGGGHFVACHDS
jgi:oligopeptide/dipeptide ABC transporter ATP-binding protein